MVHQPLKPPLRQTLEAYLLPRPDPRPELDAPSYQILENALQDVDQQRRLLDQDDDEDHILQSRNQGHSLEATALSRCVKA